ncbi:MAG: hypothetical protein L3J16_03220 [Anaerolineales bacterium]|nr:hypothetical protein [Anaerolineales bacterium]
MNTRTFLPILLGLTLLLAACAPQTAPVAATEEPAAPTADPISAEMPTAEMEPTATMSAESMGVEIQVGTHADLGKYLVDVDGNTLYIFLNDSPYTSTCSGGCLQAWPAVTTDGTPAAGNGLGASLLGTLEREDGTIQVSYNDWPLYYYAADGKAGDVLGQGANDVWYTISPVGEVIKAAISEEEYSY